MGTKFTFRFHGHLLESNQEKGRGSGSILKSQIAINRTKGLRRSWFGRVAVASGHGAIQCCMARSVSVDRIGTELRIPAKIGGAHSARKGAIGSCVLWPESHSGFRGMRLN